MAGEGRLALCIDQSLGVKLAQALRELRAPGAPDIQSIGELGLSGVADAVLFGELFRRGFGAFVTKDSALLAAPLRRDAWQAYPLSLFIMHGKCGNMPLFEQARCLFWWWPEIAREFRQAPRLSLWLLKLWRARSRPAGWRDKVACAAYWARRRRQGA